MRDARKTLKVRGQTKLLGMSHNDDAESMNRPLQFTVPVGA